MPHELTDADRLELAEWHLNRYDALRSSIASRASVVLSADALLLASAAILASRMPGETTPVPSVLTALLLLGVATTLILVCVSVLDAAGSLQSLKDFRELHGHDIPNRGPFGHGDAIGRNPDFASFAESFKQASLQEVIDYALAELWVGIQQHHLRYNKLRSSIRFLLGATFSLILTGALSLLLDLVW